MSDIIAAISTGNQVSAIGIIRLSGKGCAEVAEKVFTALSGKPLSQIENRKLILGTLTDRNGRTIDHCPVDLTATPEKTPWSSIVTVLLQFWLPDWMHYIWQVQDRQSVVSSPNGHL